jgi:Spy/CpxP family protein refolding chaperone
MNYFSKKRFVIWLIGILLLINVAAIGTIIWHSRSNRTAAATATSRDGVCLIKDELGLTPEQSKLFDDLKQEYSDSSLAILDLLEEKRIEMLKELSADQSDTARLRAIAREIGHLHAGLKQNTINHFLQVKGMCNPRQRQKLSCLYNDMCQCQGPFGDKGRQRHRRFMENRQ